MDRIISSLILALSLLFAQPVWAGLEMDGIDDYVDIPAGPDIAADESFSISAWVTAGANDDLIVQYQDNNPLIYFGVGTLAGQGTAGKLTLLLRNSAGGNLTGFSGTTTITDGAWYHVGATRDGSDNSIEIYVNGVDEGGGTWAGGSINLSGGTDHFLSTSGGGPFTGKMSDVIFWEGAEVSADDMAQLALSQGKRMPLQIQPASHFFYLPLDQGSDGTANCFNGVAGFLDISGNGRHGTGNDGGNNTGLTCIGEEVLSYP